MGADALRVYAAGGRVCVGIRVSPSAPRTAIRGVHGDKLKVAVAAPPEDNRANKELSDALAGWLRVDRGKVDVVKGHSSRNKVVAFRDIGEAELRKRLDELL